MSGFKLKNQMYAALFCALTAVASQIIIPIGLVPVSFSLVAVYLTGALLDKRAAFFSQMCYVLLGAVGAPVFSGFSGGAAKLAGPTGGYLLAYPLMALIIAWLAERWGRTAVKSAAAMALSLVCCYVLGTTQLVLLTGLDVYSALMAGVIPFIAGDVVKIALSVAVAHSLRGALAH